MRNRASRSATRPLGFLGGVSGLEQPGATQGRSAAGTQPRSAPPTRGRSPSNDSVQRVGGGCCCCGGGGGAGSSGLCSFLLSTAQPPRPREPPAQASGVQASGAQNSWVQASRAQASGTQTSAPCAQRTMSALSPPPLLSPLLVLLLFLLAAPAVLARTAESASASQPEAEHQLPPSLGNATRLGPGVTGGGGSNSSGNAVVTRISSLLRDLPTLKAAVIVACAFSALLIACLLLRVFRLGKRLKKTRKYDIITTPAERVEMAPLNEEDDEDEDTTVFDIKYR